MTIPFCGSVSVGMDGCGCWIWAGAGGVSVISSGMDTASILSGSRCLKPSHLNSFSKHFTNAVPRVREINSWKVRYSRANTTKTPRKIRLALKPLIPLMSIAYWRATAARIRAAMPIQSHICQWSGRCPFFIQGLIIVKISSVFITNTTPMMFTGKIKCHSKSMEWHFI